MNAFSSLLKGVGNAADAVFLGGTIGATRARNQFSDYLGQGQYDQAAQVAIQRGEPGYAQLAQQQGALALKQNEAQLAKQNEENTLFSSLAIGLSEISDPNTRRAALEAMKPGLSQRYGLDDEDYSQIPLDDSNALRLFGQQMIAPKDQVDQDIAQQNAVTSRINALKPSAPAAVVYTGNTENEFTKKLGEVQAKQFGDIQDEAKSAQQQIQQAQALEALLDEGVKTGRFEAATVPLKQFAKSFGIEVEGLGGQEAYRALTYQLALRLRNPDSGMGLTGNTSNRDVTFLKESVPGLEKTEQGNRLLLKMYLKIQQRKIEEATLAEQFAEDKNSLRGFRQFMSDYNSTHPIFDEQFKNEVSQILTPQQSGGEELFPGFSKLSPEEQNRARVLLGSQ